MTTLRPHRKTLSLARVAAEEVEQLLAPGEHRVVGLEQANRAHDARPLEGAEQDVVGVARAVAAEERVLHQRLAHRRERMAERRQRALRVAAVLLERHAEA